MKFLSLSGKWRWLYAALVLIFICAFGGLWWLAGTQGGLRWALNQAQHLAGPSLQLEGVRGSIASGMDIDRLLYEDDAVKVVAEKIHLRAVAAQALLWRLNIPELRVARIEVLLKPSADDEPLKLPENLRLPLPVSIAQVHIGVLGVQRNDLREAFRDLRLAYAGNAREHQLRDLHAQSDYGELALNATLGADRPFNLLAALALSRADEKLPFSLGINAAGSLAQLKLAASARVRGQTAQLQAALSPFASEWLQSLNAQTAQLDLHAFNSAWPQTQIKLALTAKSDAAQAGQLQATIDLRNALAGPADKQRIPIVHIDSIVHTDFQSLRFEHLNIDLGDAGRVSGKGVARGETTELQLAANKLNLRALYSSLRATALSGPIQLQLDKDQQSVQATLQQRDFKIALDATREGTHIKLHRVQANAGGGQLSGSGEIDLAEAMPFAADLSVARLNPAQFGDFPDGNINAKAQLKGQIDKARSALRVLDAQWRIENSTLKRQPLSSEGTVRVQAERIAQSDIHARWGGANIDASGAFGGRGDSLNWHVELPQLERMDATFSGSVQASGQLSGEWRQPQLEFSADAKNLRLPGGIAIDGAHSEGLLSKAADAALRMDLRLSDLATRDLHIASINASLRGSVEAHRLAIAMRAQNVDADAHLEGGWSDANGWRGQLVQLQNRGLYPLQLNAPVPIEASRQRVLIGRADVRFPEGGVLIHDARWENHRLASSGEFSKLRAAWLLLATGMQQQLQSSLLLNGAWSITASPQLNGSISIHRDSGDLQVQSAPVIDLGLQKLDVEARFINDRLDAQLALDSAIAKATAETRLQPVAAEQGVRLSLDSPLDMKLQLQVASLRALSTLFATTGRVDGRLQADLQGAGTLRNPLFSGTLNGDALKVDVPPFGVYLNSGRLRARLDHEAIKVDEFFIRGGEGSFSADGNLPLRMEAGGAHLNWRADKLSLLARSDMRLSVSGNGRGDFDGKQLKLQGELRADRGYFEFGENRLPELGDDVHVVGQVKPATKPRQARTPFEVDMQLDLGNQLEVHGYGLKGMLTGKVHLTTADKGELRAAGRIRTERASFTAYGQQLQVEQGLIIFDGPIDNPGLYIQAWRRNQAVAVGVQITGTVTSPQVELVSEPPVPEGEKLSWLVLGRAPDNAQSGDIALLQAAAGTLFSRGDKVGINQKLAHGLGLDELTLRGSGALTGNVVALGKRLSDKIYITYEQGIGAAQNLVQLDYTLSRRWSARLETGTLSSIGVIYRIVFD